MRPSEHDHLATYRRQEEARSLRREEERIEAANPGQQ
jgi:hypothetical protein